MGDGGVEDEGENNSYEDRPLLDEQDEVDVKDEEMDFLDDQEGRDSRDSTGRFHNDPVFRIRIHLIRIRIRIKPFLLNTEPELDPIRI
jgi:hypothetical protein